jgi:hypothetical protein
MRVSLPEFAMASKKLPWQKMTSSFAYMLGPIAPQFYKSEVQRMEDQEQNPEPKQGESGDHRPEDVSRRPKVPPGRHVKPPRPFGSH